MREESWREMKIKRYKDVSLDLFITTTHTETQWHPPELCPSLSGLSPSASPMSLQ